MRWGVRAAGAIAAVVALPELGCGKTTIATARISDEGGVPEELSTRDASPKHPRDDGAPADGASDAGRSDGSFWPHPITDATPGATASDAGDATPLDCNSVGQLAGHILTARRPKRVLFSPDGKHIVMIVRAEVQPPGGGTMDDLILITLPSGAATTLAHRVRDVSWLGQTNMLFVKSSTAELQVVDLDGNALAIAPNACDYVGTPDGRYVYVARDCDARTGIGRLDVVDVQTRDVTSYGDVLSRPENLSLLPDGRWVAYVEASFREGGATPGGSVHLRDRTINHFPIGELFESSGAPSFITSESLLFQAPDPSFGPTDIYRYTFGGTTSYRMATDRHVGFDGYKVSPDRHSLLVARWLEPQANALYAVHLDDGVETLLASDLLLYQSNMIGPTAFAFTWDGSRVIYLNHQYTGTSSVALGGGRPMKISNGTGFVVSPYADRVATLDTSTVLETSSIYVSDPASSTPSFGYDANALIRAVTFVPGDRGLVFVESRLDGEHLRHLSFRDGAPTDLGTWAQSNLPLNQFSLGEMKPGYPVDPTGCYVVVDSDTPGPEGVSVALVPN
jgi:hypothetical protein